MKNANKDDVRSAFIINLYSGGRWFCTGSGGCHANSKMALVNCDGCCLSRVVSCLLCLPRSCQTPFDMPKKPDLHTVLFTFQGSACLLPTHTLLPLEQARGNVPSSLMLPFEKVRKKRVHASAYYIEKER